LVERDGRFWLENLPLQTGTNTVSVTATDAGGRVTTVNMTVLSSTVVLTMTPVPDSQLYQSEVCAQGNIAGSDCTVTVNGMMATMGDGGSWRADHVPVSPGGVATFRLVATNPSQSPVEMTVAQDKPPVVYVARYAMSSAMSMTGYTNDLQEPKVETFAQNWELGVGGHEDHMARKEYAGWHETTCQTTWPADGWPPVLEGTQQIVDSGQTNPPIVVSPFTPPIEIGEFADVAAWESGAMCGTAHYSRRMQTVVKMFTGGKAVSGQKFLLELFGNLERVRFYWSWATWHMTGDGVIPGQGTIWGSMGRADAENVACRQFSGGQTVDVTPRTGDPTLTLAALNEASGSNIGTVDPAIASAQPAKYRGAIKFGPREATDRTNFTWIGNNVFVQFELVDCATQQTMPGSVCSNFVWSIPGPAYARIAYSSENGLVEALSKTNSRFSSFCWSCASDCIEVECAAQYRGEMVHARAWFEVRSPEVALYLTPKSPVEVSTNRQSAPEISSWQWYWLQCGRGRVWGNGCYNGMRRDYEIVDLKGYTNKFRLELIQLVDWTIRENFAGTNLARSLSATGFDDTYPTDLWPVDPTNLPSGRTNGLPDSPGMPLQERSAFLWQRNAFQTYLLFVPEDGMPVPLKRADWAWSGGATNHFAANFPPIFSEAVVPSTPAPVTGQACCIPPTWTNRVTGNTLENSPNWQTNAVPYPISN
jgi:hypothetical protein